MMDEDDDDATFFVGGLRCRGRSNWLILIGVRQLPKASQKSVRRCTWARTASRRSAATWRREKNLAAAVSKRAHMEEFALLNGSVFSIWYNVRKALDPRFDPAEARRVELKEEAEGTARARGGRRITYNFEPHVKIQLVTTSDGQKLGGSK